MRKIQDISRRGFLGAGLAVTAYGAPAKRVSKLRFGLTTYQWGADWDIPTIIANCTKAKAFGVEMRTTAKYKHGVEIDISDARRREVKKMFADSPVKVVGIASAARFDSPDPAKLQVAIEDGKAHVKLSHDVGASGIRVFPNDWQKNVPEEKTIAQIAQAMNTLGKFAADFNQEIRIENHGSAGRLTTLRKILDQVDQKNVGVKLNCDARDAADGGFAAHFALVKGRLAHTLHMRDPRRPEFPYQLQWDLLIDSGWQGWCLVEETTKVPDRLQALIEVRETWEKQIAQSLRRA